MRSDPILTWVIGTAALLWVAPDLFSPTGKLILIVVALLVGAFALLQFLGVRQLRVQS